MLRERFWGSVFARRVFLPVAHLISLEMRNVVHAIAGCSSSRYEPLKSPPSHADRPSVTLITDSCCLRAHTRLTLRCGLTEGPAPAEKDGERTMPDTNDGRRRFLKTALVSAGAFIGALASRSAAYARLSHDPMLKEMEKRVGKTPIATHDDVAAALCDKASCNPGCQNGCSGSCHSSCKSGNA